MEGNIKYMSCQICGRYEAVGDETTAVKCGRCVSMIMMNKYPYEEPKSAYKPTGRPAGWHWMSEFVDKDGNVFHRGKEQPKLKGTLKPTKVKPRKKKKKLTADEKLQQDINKWKKRKRVKRKQNNK